MEFLSYSGTSLQDPSGERGFQEETSPSSTLPPKTQTHCEDLSIVPEKVLMLIIMNEQLLYHRRKFFSFTVNQCLQINLEYILARYVTLCKNFHSTGSVSRPLFCSTMWARLSRETRSLQLHTAVPWIRDDWGSEVRNSCGSPYISFITGLDDTLSSSLMKVFTCASRPSNTCGVRRERDVKVNIAKRSFHLQSPQPVRTRLCTVLAITMFFLINYF